MRLLVVEDDQDLNRQIVKALKDSYPEVRLQAAIALGRMRAESAVPALMTALSEEERWISSRTRYCCTSVFALRFHT